MVPQRHSCLILFLSFVLSAGSAQAVLLDDFNRPNSPVLGADWIQVPGDGFRIEYGKARGLLQSLAGGALAGLARRRRRRRVTCGR
ncbi:MAG: hypothetical protein ISS72_06700 [Candidatus Brocadiae bacterium]|nr:hypothetical protein [Candidatus Brocadiia bacterium]